MKAFAFRYSLSVGHRYELVFGVINKGAVPPLTTRTDVLLADSIRLCFQFLDFTGSV